MAKHDELFSIWRKLLSLSNSSLIRSTSVGQILFIVREGEKKSSKFLIDEGKSVLSGLDDDERADATDGVQKAKVVVVASAPFFAFLY